MSSISALYLARPRQPVQKCLHLLWSHTQPLCLARRTWGLQQLNSNTDIAVCGLQQKVRPEKASVLCKYIPLRTLKMLKYPQTLHLHSEEEQLINLARNINLSPQDLPLAMFARCLSSVKNPLQCKSACPPLMVCRAANESVNRKK